MENSTPHKLLLEAINRITSHLAEGLEVSNVFDVLLSDLLHLSNSSYGFVGEMRYNNSVKMFNTYRRTVFGGFFASLRGLNQPREYFEVAEAAKEVPVVKF